MTTHTLLRILAGIIFAEGMFFFFSFLSLLEYRGPQTARQKFRTVFIGWNVVAGAILLFAGVMALGVFAIWGEF